MRFMVGQAAMATETGTRPSGRTTGVALWAMQGVLAVLFLGSGVSKLVLPIEDLTRAVAYPALSLRVIGVCAVRGALGLVRVRPGPGSDRAHPAGGGGTRGDHSRRGGAGALAIGGGAGALVPFGVGLLLVVVAYGRTRPRVHHPAGHQAGRRVAGAGSR